MKGQVMTPICLGLNISQWRFFFFCVYFEYDNMTLDLDSSRIQLDTLGHTPTPSVSVTSCHLCFLPGNPIFRRSLLTTPLQFALGRPGPLLYPGTCQYSACCSMRWWSIRKTCPLSKSSCSQYVVHGLLSSSGSDLHISYPVFP